MDNNPNQELKDAPREKRIAFLLKGCPRSEEKSRFRFSEFTYAQFFFFLSFFDAFEVGNEQIKIKSF